MIFTTPQLKPLIEQGKAVFTIRTKDALNFLANDCADVTKSDDRHATYKAGRYLLIKVPEKLTTANTRISFRRKIGSLPAHYVYFSNTHRVASHAFLSVEKDILEELDGLLEEDKLRTSNTVLIAPDAPTIITSKRPENIDFPLTLAPFPF